jgi:hypothetical protein
MIVVTAAAIFLGLAVAIQGLVPLIMVSIVWLVLPTPLIICAIFGRGDIRAFAIGALMPWLLLMRAPPPGMSILPLLLVFPPVCGVVAVVTHRWVQRQT